jgi:hypothetical protein
MHKTLTERDVAGEEEYLKYLEKMRSNGYDPVPVPYRDLQSKQRAHWRKKAEEK